MAGLRLSLVHSLSLYLPLPPKQKPYYPQQLSGNEKQWQLL